MELPLTPTLMTAPCAVAQRADFVTNRGGYCANNQVVNPSTALPSLLHRFHPAAGFFVCLLVVGSKINLL